jgi:hypothetical protein
MKRLFTLLFIVALTVVSFTSCVEEEQFSDTPEGNFEALWKIIDQHYCFFDYKKEVYGLDWDEVYAKYKPQINDNMNETQLFEVLGKMLGELRDGHVNLYSSYDLSRYWSWYEDYPSNFSDTLQRNYLGTDYRLASGIKYTILDDNIGYVYCGTFENDLGDSNLDQMLLYLAPCNGLIIDVRNNGGGKIVSAEKLASRFTDNKLLVGYMQHKTGTGHSDFSSMETQYLEPSDGIRWHKKVVVITNRKVFSSANEYVKYMRCCDNVTQIGDKSGGGAGFPYSSELPCGWSVRFSACQIFDKDKNSTEFGIEPDNNVSLSTTDFLRGKDTIIEFARKKLSE